MHSQSKDVFSTALDAEAHTCSHSGTDRDPASRCAIKYVICNPTTRNTALLDLRNEFQVSRSFTHPALRRALRYDEQPMPASGLVRAVLTFEPASGHTLAQRPPTNWRQVAACFAQIADALVALHDLGYLHGCLRAEDILVAADDVTGTRPASVKLINFEKSRRIAHPHDTGDDVRALGLVLHWALTGCSADHAPADPDQPSVPAEMQAAAPQDLHDLVELCLVQDDLNEPAVDLHSLAHRLRALAAEACPQPLTSPSARGVISAAP